MQSLRSQGAAVGIGLFALGLSTPAAAQFNVPGNYATIQAAVDAAPSGATIRVASGTYAEQVVIDGKNLRLRGVGGPVVQAPAAGLAQTGLPLFMFRSIWVVKDARVNIRGFTFDGQQRGDEFTEGFAGCSYLGARGHVHDCDFSGFRGASLTGAPQTIAALYANNAEELNTAVQRLVISRNTFADNKNSIVLVGDDRLPFAAGLRLSVDVSQNTITGVGATPDGVQNGMVLHSDVGGAVVRNRITDHLNTAPAQFNSNGIASGLTFIPGVLNGQGTQRILYAHNTFDNNRVGIAILGSDHIPIWHNTFIGTGATLAPGEGVAIVSAAHNTRIIGNHLSNIPLSPGILLLGTETLGGALGVANDTWIFFNHIHGSPAPVVEGTGVTGTIEFFNHIHP